MSDEERTLLRRHLEQFEREMSILEYRLREVEDRLAGIELRTIPMPASEALEVLRESR